MDFSNSSFYPPTSEDIDRGEEYSKLINRYASLKSYNVRVFDMSKQEDIAEYTEVMKEIMNGLPKKTHYVWTKDKTIVDGNWKIFMEWSVYTLSDPSKPKETENESGNE